MGMDIQHLRYLRLWSIHQLKNKIEQQYIYKNKASLKYQPINLNIYVTDRCTLNCKMCLQHSLDENLEASLSKYYHQNGNDITLDTLRYILDRFNRSLFVCLAGVGEPFLNPNLGELIKLANKNKKIVGVITNGTLLEDKIMDVVKSPLNSISISLNALNKDEYMDISCCKSDLFDEVVDNINSLVRERNKEKSNLQIRVSFICHKGNYKNIPKMIELSKSLGVNGVDLINLIPTMKFEFTRDYCLYNDNNDAVELLNGLNPDEYKFDIRLPKLLIPGCNNRKCRWYFESISIDSTGNIGSCGAIMSPNPDYGNIFNDKDPWNNQHFIDMRKIFINSSLPLIGCCKYCTNNI
jgi:MoaA/NifB/PqqE/SkfB family radical SAM enzyme